MPSHTCLKHCQCQPPANERSANSKHRTPVTNTLNAEKAKNCDTFSAMNCHCAMHPNHFCVSLFLWPTTANVVAEKAKTVDDQINQNMQVTDKSSLLSRKEDKNKNFQVFLNVCVMFKFHAEHCGFAHGFCPQGFLNVRQTNPWYRQSEFCVFFLWEIHNFHTLFETEQDLCSDTPPYQ